MGPQSIFSQRRWTTPPVAFKQSLLGSAERAGEGHEPQNTHVVSTCRWCRSLRASRSLWKLSSAHPTRNTSVCNHPAWRSSCKAPQHPVVFVVLLFIYWTDVTKVMSSSSTFFFVLFCFKSNSHGSICSLSCHVGWFQTMSSDSQTAVDEGGSCHSLSLCSSQRHHVSRCHTAISA